MKEFKDNQGKKWQVVMTIGSCKEVKDKLNFDLLHPEMEQGEGENTFIDRLVNDSLFDYNVAIILCKESIIKNGYEDLTEAQLGDLFGAQEYKALLEAFYNEYTDFFLTSGNKGAAAYIQKALEVKQLQSDVLVANVNSFSLNAEDVKKQLVSETEDQTTESGNLSGSGLE